MYFPGKISTFSFSEFFWEIASWPPSYDLLLYQVNFVRTRRALIVTYLYILLVKDHLHQTHFNFYYSQVHVPCSVYPWWCQIESRNWFIIIKIEIRPGGSSRIYKEGLWLLKPRRKAQLISSRIYITCGVRRTTTSERFFLLRWFLFEKKCDLSLL